MTANIVMQNAEEKDDPYFKKLLTDTKSKLLKLSEEWNEEAKSIKCEDQEQVLGEIRSVVGQAHLVMNERLKQFEGLVDDCESGLSEKPVTCDDLLGFWEMIDFQVQDVLKKFQSLALRKGNNWEPVVHIGNENKAPEIKKRSKKVIGTKPKKNSTAALHKSEARKRISAFKNAMKKSSNDKKTFQAGFFQVSSPVQENPKISSPAVKRIQKKPSTPSPKLFMHGRVLRQTRQRELRDNTKKTLNFNNES
jgi:disks large-associated protein 5